MDQVRHLMADHSDEFVAKTLGLTVEYVASLRKPAPPPRVPEMPLINDRNANKRREGKPYRCDGCGAKIKAGTCLACQVRK